MRGSRHIARVAGRRPDPAGAPDGGDRQGGPSPAPTLFLDESTSALGEGARGWFTNLLVRLRDAGTTLVFITHRLGEVSEHCDHATVLRNGEAVGSFAIDEVDEDEVVRMMIGRSMDQAFPDRRPAVDREVKLQTRGLGLDGAFNDVDLELREGEILGVAGLDGQGQRELFLSLFGVLPSDQGEILIDDNPVRIRSPQDAINSDLGISLVPEDRKTEGAVPDPVNGDQHGDPVTASASATTVGSTSAGYAAAPSRRRSGSTLTRVSSGARWGCCRAATSRRW